MTATTTYDYNPQPILVYCNLVSHRTEVVHESDCSYEVPEKVALVRIQVHSYTGATPSLEQVWRELNSYGYYSRQYRLTNYWQPEHLNDNEQPF